MNNYIKCFYFLTLLFFGIACNNNSVTEKQSTTDSLLKGTYAYDANFLKKHTRKTLN